MAVNNWKQKFATADVATILDAGKPKFINDTWHQPVLSKRKLAFFRKKFEVTGSTGEWPAKHNYKTPLHPGYRFPLNKNAIRRKIRQDNIRNALQKQPKLAQDHKKAWKAHKKKHPKPKKKQRKPPYIPFTDWMKPDPTPINPGLIFKEQENEFISPTTQAIKSHLKPGIHKKK